LTHHLFCLTIDADPDGLSGKLVNRRALTWHSLEHIPQLLSHLEESTVLADIYLPITWFIRIDGQLRDAFGDSTYLLEQFDGLWSAVKERGHELGWHPHLYQQSMSMQEPTLIVDPTQAREELERLWNDITVANFHPTSFRNGEGWHTEHTYTAVEQLGLDCDSTAIPGRRGREHHPMDWLHAPNQPYFPDRIDIRRAGQARPLLEIPMNTWLVKTPYDAQPTLRYMNPTIQEAIFAAALGLWKQMIVQAKQQLCVWALIFHPDEVMASAETDLLYAHSPETVAHNIVALTQAVTDVGDTFEFTTLSAAAGRWHENNSEHYEYELACA